MNKNKVFTITVLLVFLVAMLAGCEQAKKAVKLPEPGTQPEDIKGEGVPVTFYNKHRVTIDFFIMFALFCAISMLGLKKFGAEGAPAKGVAVALALALALAAMKAGFSPSFFIPFVKNALFLIIFFMIFMIVRQTIGGEAWIGPFLIALAITFIAFNVGNIVLDPEKKFDLASMWHVPTATKVEEISVDNAKVSSDIQLLAKKHNAKITDDPTATADAAVHAIENKIGVLKPDDPDYKKNFDELMKERDQLFELKKKYQQNLDRIDMYKEKIRPVKPNVLIAEGAVAGPGQALTCQVTGSVIEQETERSWPPTKFTYVWYKDGKKTLYGEIDVQSYTSELKSGITKVGEKWYCEATANVAGVTGNAGRSNEVEIKAGIFAEKPSALPVIIKGRSRVAVGELEEAVAEITGGSGEYEIVWEMDEGHGIINIKGSNKEARIKYFTTKEGIVKLRVRVIDKTTKQTGESDQFSITVKNAAEDSADSVEVVESYAVQGNPQTIDDDLDKLSKQINELTRLMRLYK